MYTVIRLSLHAENAAFVVKYWCAEFIQAHCTKDTHPV